VLGVRVRGVQLRADDALLEDRAIVFEPPPPTPTIFTFVRSFVRISSSSASTRMSSKFVPPFARLSSGKEFIA